MPSFETRIYYEDQTAWGPSDLRALWRYFNRLFLTIGPTPAALADPEATFARIQARRVGRRDDEVAAMDLARMNEDTRYLMKHTLIAMGRYELALERFTNLGPLQDVGELDHTLVLDENPTLVNDHYTAAGILL